MDVLIMFFNPSFDQTFSLSSVHFSMLTGNAVNPWCFRSQIILSGLKKAGELPW
jgi:hypothetical protein